MLAIKTVAKSKGLHLCVAVIAAATLLGAALPSSGSVSALSNISPNPSDMLTGGEAGGMSHVLKNEDVAQVTRIKLAAYYERSGAGGRSTNGRQITITKGTAGEVCRITDSIKNSGSGGIRVVINGEEVANIPIKRVCSGSQSSRFFNRTFNFPANQNMKLNADVNMYYAEITIIYYGTDIAKSNENSLNFKVKLDGRGSGNGLLSPRENAAEEEFGLRSGYFIQNESPWRNIRTSIDFGFPCTGRKSADNKLFVYDADAVFGSQYIWVVIKEPGKAARKLNFNEYGGPSDRVLVDWKGIDEGFKLKGSDNEFNMITIKDPIPGAKYTMEFLNRPDGRYAPNANVLSMGFPYSSILAGVRCDYLLKPYIKNVSGNAADPTSVRATGGVDKQSGEGAVTGSEHPWQIYEVKYTQAPTKAALSGYGEGAKPCDNYQSANRVSCKQRSGAGNTYKNPGAQNVSGSENPPPVLDPVTGLELNPVTVTHVCFFTMVKNPSDKSTDDNDWRYTNMLCANSSIEPKVHVWDGDVKVNNGINTSTTIVDGRRYGSGAEYGTFAGNGDISGMASGGHFSGDPSTAFVPLTFANTLPRWGNFGVNYVPSLPTTPVLRPQASPTEPHVLGDGGKAVYPAGSREIIYYEGTLNIKNNLEYTNPPGISDLSQVIIVADNITIQPNVSRIDPWLWAKESITTCGFAAGTNLTLDSCSGDLIFNGEVMVGGEVNGGNLYLQRTGGSRIDAPGKPAEVFNLRADNILAGYAGKPGTKPVAKTRVITELPPRF